MQVVVLDDRRLEPQHTAGLALVEGHRVAIEADEVGTARVPDHADDGDADDRQQREREKAGAPREDALARRRSDELAVALPATVTIIVVEIIELGVGVEGRRKGRWQLVLRLGRGVVEPVADRRDRRGRVGVEALEADVLLHREGL